VYAAAKRGHCDVLCFLREQGVDILAAPRDQFKEPPIFVAASFGKDDVVRLLHSWGVSVSAKNAVGAARPTVHHRAVALTPCVSMMPRQSTVRR
jgi:hypothetical protein